MFSLADILVQIGQLLISYVLPFFGASSIFDLLLQLLGGII